MRPTDVLAHRRIMLEHVRDLIQRRDAGFKDTDDEQFDERLSDVAHIVHDCECYFVTVDMTAVAKSAAKTMPSQDLRLDDIPSDRGFLLYDSPVGAWDYDDGPADPVVGFAWTLDRDNPSWDQPGGGEIAFRGEYDPDDPEHDTPPDRYVSHLTLYPLTQMPNRTHMLVPVWRSNAGPLMWTIGEEPGNDEGDLAATVLATWTLMQQSLSVSERAPVDRPERRRGARLGLPPDVLIVRLRRRSLDGETAEIDDSADGVAWSHRWLVSGHWRNQWLPSQGRAPTSVDIGLREGSGG